MEAASDLRHRHCLDSTRRRRKLKRAHLALLLVLLTCLLPRLRRPIPPTFPADFRVYYSAARLVLHRQPSAIYTGADRGTDPQKLIATPDTPIYKEAHAAGLPFVGLYLYPPLLADMLTTIAWLPLPAATTLWYILNIALLLLTAYFVAALLGVRLLQPAACLILFVIFGFVPVLQCLVDGQITIFLLFLWAAGLFFLQRKREGVAGVAFALAIAIKLTPALVLLPFLLWRRWRLLGSALLSLGVMAAVCVAVNGAATCWLFVSKVMPSMSGAIPNYTNYSIAAATERLIAVLALGSLSPFPEHLSPATVLCGRVASFLLLAALAAALYRDRRSLSPSNQLIVIGLLGLYAPVISPVSWFHAYATAFPAFALLWYEILQRPPGTVYLLALTAVTLMLGTAVSENLLSTLCLRLPHPLVGAVLQCAQLLGAAALVLYRIHSMDGREQSNTGQPSFAA